MENRTESGKIIRGVGGFYYVDVEGRGVYECRARGIFRKEKRKPLVGDNVSIRILDDTDMEASLDEILPRRNELIRPAAANIDQAFLVFAAADPQPVFGLLDRSLINLAARSLPVTVFFNKSDLVSREKMEEYLDIYRACGSQAFGISVRTGEGMDIVRELLQGRTTMLAGPSGAGKSSLTNFLCPEAAMEVGEISRKIRRGKQTTRHTQLNKAGDGTFLLDTPGYSTLYLPDIDENQFAALYPEFQEYAKLCRFPGCRHIHEPDCAVKEAVAAGGISRTRYGNYCILADEIRDKKRY